MVLALLYLASCEAPLTEHCDETSSRWVIIGHSQIGKFGLNQAGELGRQGAREGWSKCNRYGERVRGRPGGLAPSRANKEVRMRLFKTVAVGMMAWAALGTIT